MKNPNDTNINVISTGVCICGAEIRMGYSGPNENPTVIHKLPVCELFLSIDNPVDYLTEVNNRIEAIANKMAN